MSLILPLLVWLFQDILQLIFMGIFLVPELFFLALLFVGLMSSSEKAETYRKYIAMGFIGGLFWDLRWTNMPGLTAGLHSFLLAFVFIIWHQMPVQGRNDRAFAVCALTAQFISAMAHALLWRTPNSVAIRLFLIQQLLGIVVILLLSFVYRKATYKHV